MDCLPSHNSLPIHILASSFKHKATTYKFYWFLSLMEEIEKGNYAVSKQHIFARMIANSWYTINYFHLSFGKQDQLERAVTRLLEIESLTIDENKERIFEKLVSSTVPETVRSLRYFDGEVPHCFLSPWYNDTKGHKKTIYNLSQSYSNNSIYAVDETKITVNPAWIQYLSDNSGILKAFCCWNLCLYLQKHNPNVPDIANKLIKWPTRNTLTNQRNFWNSVIEHNGPVTCIYTKRQLGIKEFAVEHFIPFAFVSHDLIWNLIPADKSFNSSKSDKLPQFDEYFDLYFDLQLMALKTVYVLSPNHKLLQDYLTFLPDLNLLQQADGSNLKEQFRNNIMPLITIAANNGFEYMKLNVYSKE